MGTNCPACRLVLWHPPSGDAADWAPALWEGDDPYVWDTVSGSAARVPPAAAARADALYVLLRRAGIIADICGTILSFSIELTLREELEAEGRRVVRG